MATLINSAPVGLTGRPQCRLPGGRRQSERSAIDAAPRYGLPLPGSLAPRHEYARTGSTRRLSPAGLGRRPASRRRNSHPGRAVAAASTYGGDAQHRLVPATTGAGPNHAGGLVGPVCLGHVHAAVHGQGLEPVAHGSAGNQVAWGTSGIRRTATGERRSNRRGGSSSSAQSHPPGPGRLYIWLARYPPARHIGTASPAVSRAAIGRCSGIRAAGTRPAFASSRLLVEGRPEAARRGHGPGQTSRPSRPVHGATRVRGGPAGPFPGS